MNRRKFVTNTGLATVGSSFFGIHLLSQSAMATSFEFNSIQSLPENWDSPAINLNISKFNVETSNIDISNPLTITIKAGIGNTLAQVTPPIELTLDTGDGINDISNNIGPIDLTNSSEVNVSSQNLSVDDILDINIQIELECDEVSTKSDVNQVVLNIIEGDLPDSGIARWTFDDSDTVDSTSLDKWNNNDGTIVGNVTTSSQGIQNESYSFDSGNNNHISVPPINPREKITVSAWVKSGLNGQYNQNWSVVSNYQAFILGPRYNNENKMAFIVHTDTGWNYDSVASISNPEEWNHFIGTYDYETSKAKLYQNNTLVSTGTNPSGKISVENTDWEIGRREGKSGEDFNGKIDDVQIYGRVLTQEERDKLYNYYNV
jgi:hypothetical protein